MKKRLLEEGQLEVFEMASAEHVFNFQAHSLRFDVSPIPGLNRLPGSNFL